MCWILRQQIRNVFYLEFKIEVHQGEKMGEELLYFVCVNKKARDEGQRRVFSLPLARYTRCSSAEGVRSERQSWLELVSKWKGYVTPKLGGMCWHHFLTCVKVDDEAKEDYWSGRSQCAWRGNQPILPLPMGQEDIPVWKASMRMEVSRWCRYRWAEEVADLEGDGISDKGIGRWYCYWQGFCWPVE